MPETGGTIPPPMSASRIAVTSIVRHAEPGERSGFLRVLDLDAKRVLSTTAVPESAFRAIGVRVDFSLLIDGLNNITFVFRNNY